MISDLPLRRLNVKVFTISIDSAPGKGNLKNELKLILAAGQPGLRIYWADRTNAVRSQNADSSFFRGFDSFRPSAMLFSAPFQVSGTGAVIEKTACGDERAGFRPVPAARNEEREAAG